MAKSKDLLRKLELVQKILSPIIDRLKKGESIDQKEILKALQAVAGEAYEILSRDFHVFNIGKKEELHVMSEWAYQADREEALER